MAAIPLKDAEHDGAWGTVIQDATIQIHSIVLPDGKVLAFGTDGANGYYDARFVYSLYDPATGELKVLPNTTGTNIFCSNMSLDPTTGNVVIMGGDNHNTGEGGGTWTGRADVVLFDYRTQTIRNVSESDPAFKLHEARWYGTTLTLANGEILMVGGRDEQSIGSTFAEIYNPKTGVRQLTGTEMKDFREGEGSLTGTYYYAHAWQVSDGSVIIIEAGGNSNSGHDIYRMDVTGNGSVAKIGKLPFDTRNLTSSIMYEPDKVLVASSTGQVWKADLSQAQPKWEVAFAFQDEDAPNTLVARTNGTFVMMSDGKVAMVGGSGSAGVLADSMADAQYSTAFWDPSTGKVTYSEKGDMTRMYHSSAQLLPDGTIYSAGGGSPGPQANANLQILTPASLFDKDGNPVTDRPTIVGAPKDIASGSTIRITVDDTSDIAKLSFIKGGAATHGRVADSRYIALDYKVIDANTIEVAIPKANVAIPGSWMLFAVDKAGVPSVAKIVGVDMAPIVDTGSLDVGPTMIYNIDHEQVDGAFALAVTVRFDDLNAAKGQKVFDLHGNAASDIWFGQVGESRDVEFVIQQDGKTYRIVATDAIVEGEVATWRVGVDADGVMRITKGGDVIAVGQGVVPADVERPDYVIGHAPDGAGALVGMVRDLKIANYGNFAELDASAPSSPCAKTGEAKCLCDLLVPNVDDTPGNDAPRVFEKYSALTGGVSELKDGTPGENKTVLTSTGIIAFADADAEPHTATVAPLGANYLGELTINKPTTDVGVKTGSVTWTFKVNDKALDGLAEGQQVVQSYDVTIDDGHGGVAVQRIAVTLTGAADAAPPTEAQIKVVQALAPTAGDDAIVLGDAVRVMTGANFAGGANSLTAGNFFELRQGNLDFSNSRNAASFTTGANANLNTGDILMNKGGIKNTVSIGADSKFSMIQMNGAGAATADTVTIGDNSTSDAGIQMNSAGRIAGASQIRLTLGDGVKIGGAITANGADSAKTFVFGDGVTVAGDLQLNGARNTNTVTVGDGFTLNGTLTGTTTGADVVTIGRDWNITGGVNLGAGDDTLALTTSKLDPNVTTFSGGAGRDRLVLTIDAADRASFDAAAKAAGWVATGDGTLTASATALTWKGMTFNQFEDIELKVIGANDAPTIVASGTTKAGTLTEIADGAAGENAITHLTNGTIQFADRNAGDEHRVTIAPKEAGYIGSIEYRQPSQAQFGLLPWTFKANDADMDKLAAGETRVQSYVVTITDNKGASTTETITVTLNGTNDAPTIVSSATAATGTVTERADGSAGENAATLHSEGRIGYADVDAIDTHTASFVANGANYLGTFTLGKAANGAITWGFDVGDAAVDRLGANDVLTQSYTVTLDDGHGGTATQTVVVTIGGAYDDPNSNQGPVVDVSASVIDGRVAEAAAGGAADTEIATTGRIAYADPDAAGVLPKVTVAAREAGYAGALSVGDVTAGQVGWRFAAKDGALDFLAAGETRTQVYDVAIDDGRGGVTVQAVRITLTGTNDAPVIVSQSSQLTGGVSELPDTSAGENSAPLTTAGSIAFRDVDLTDTHTATATARGAGYVGQLTLGTARDGTIGWTFAVNDGALDRLGAGEVVTQVYDVVVDDGKGGRATTAVTVTLTGALDDNVPRDVTIGALPTTAGNDDIVLGDRVTLSNGGGFGAGANALKAGDGFVLKAGALDFTASTGAASLSLGKNADLNGGDIVMNGNGIANSVVAGDGSKLSYIGLNGGGAKASQSVTLGDKVVTDYAITMDGSGVATDRMETAVKIGSGSRIGGFVSMDGNYAQKSITMGDAVTIAGGIDMRGVGNTTALSVGDGATVVGAIITSEGADTVQIGKDWKVDGIVDLGAGNDTLRIGTATRDTTGTIGGGTGIDTLEVTLTQDQLASFESAASAARWVRNADGSWDTQGRALSWQGQSYTAFETARTVIAAGTSAAPVATRIAELQASAGADDFILTANTTLGQTVAFGAGANSLTAGDNFVMNGAYFDYSASTGAARLSLGANAHLNGADIVMNQGGIANSVVVGDDGKLSYIGLNGGGAKASQTVVLGDRTVTDYAVVMNGSGVAADRMESSLKIGDGSKIAGGIVMNGSYVEKAVTLGDNVAIDGTIGLGGANNATTLAIGTGTTIAGGIYGSTGNDVVQIGKDWRIDGVVDLGAGNDTLRIGTTTRDSAGTITGGAGTDTLEVTLADAAQKAAFDTAAKAAGWVQLTSGDWDAKGRPIVWQGTTYTAFETARTAIDGGTAKVAGMTMSVTGGDNFIVGGKGDDVLTGGAGNDRFVAGAGDDRIDGGTGHDTLDLPGKPSDYQFALGVDGALHVTSATGEHDILRDVEDIHFQGSAETIQVDHLHG